MASSVSSYAPLPVDSASTQHRYSHSHHSHSHSHSPYYPSAADSFSASGSVDSGWHYSPPSPSHSHPLPSSSMTGSGRGSSSGGDGMVAMAVAGGPSASADMYSQQHHHHLTHDSYLPSPSSQLHYDRPLPTPLMAAAASPAARSSPASYRHLPTTSATATASAVPSSSLYGGPVDSKPRAPRFIDTFQSRILSQPPPPASPSSTSSPSSPTHSPAPNTAPSKPKRKRRTPTLDPYTKHIRSVKHNEAEVRRRQRLNGLLVELAECVGCRKPQKSAILRVTLEKVRTMERKIRALEDKVRDAEQGAKQLDDDRDAGVSVKKARTIKMAMVAETETSGAGSYDSAYGLPALSPLTGPSSSSGSSSSSVSSMSSSSSAGTWSGGFDGLGGLSGTVSSLSSSATSGLLADVSIPSPLPLSLFSHNLSLPHSSAGPSTSAADASHSSTDMLQSAVQSGVKQEPDGAGDSSGALLRSGQLNVLKAACVPMNVVDLSGRVLDCNAEFESFLGYSLATLRSSSFTFFEYTHPASLNPSFAQLSELIAHDDRPVRGSKLYIAQSGQVKKANTTLFMLKDGEGRHNHVCVVLEPVSHDGCIDAPPAAAATL